MDKTAIRLAEENFDREYGDRWTRRALERKMNLKAAYIETIEMLTKLDFDPHGEVTRYATNGWGTPVPYKTGRLRFIKGDIVISVGLRKVWAYAPRPHGIIFIAVAALLDRRSIQSMIDLVGTGEIPPKDKWMVVI